MPEDQRPMEKMLFAGPGALSKAELLALIIRSGTREKSAIVLAEEILAFASTESGGLGKADPRELMKISGVGTAKACQIAASIELSKRLMSDTLRDSSPRVDCVDDVAGLLMEEMMYERRELFMALFLDTKLKVESKKIISIGSLDSAPVHPREVFRQAVRRSAAAVVFVHNHPSGDPTPSNEDILTTKRLVECGKLLGIEVEDHIVIGDGRFISLQGLTEL